MKHGLEKITHESTIENIHFPVEIWASIIHYALINNPILTLMTVCKTWLLICKDSDFFKQYQNVFNQFQKIIIDAFGGFKKVFHIPVVSINRGSFESNKRFVLQVSDFKGNFCIRGTDAQNVLFISLYRKDKNFAEVLYRQTTNGKFHWRYIENYSSCNIQPYTGELPDSIIAQMGQRYAEPETNTHDAKKNNRPQPK